MSKKTKSIAALITIFIAGALYYNKYQHENDPMAGIPDTAALEEESENKISQSEGNSVDNISREKDLSQDAVYNYTNNIIAQLRPYPPCVTLAQTMRDIASSNAPADIRERQVNIIYNKMPSICVQ
ncbi:hypothetical protein H3H36_15670 [Duganella sp. FT3S]|uniref:Uncharacterized protein n=1 Tax=Rugamonas fusca TaxID=2758568 RepID=A0A7W2EIY6_9BURK|nr:hypothetical protein [Rugamonas fusca]MBA5606795.1 hypothetical protein [Rugamonas fusca]